MNYLNKVKMIKAVYGDLEHCTNSTLFDYGNLDKMNIFIENFISKEDAINSRYIRFLMRQDLKIAKFIYYKLKKKSSYKDINFNTVDSYIYEGFKNIFEAELYCNNVGSGYEDSVRDVLNFLKKNPSQFINLNKLLKKANLNYEFRRIIPLDILFAMSYNSVFSNMNDEDIVTCVARSKNFDIDYKTITKEDIDILFNEYYNCIPSLKESNLDIVKILKPHLKSSDVNLLSKALALFDDLPTTEYLLDVLIENNKKATLSLIIKACKKGYIKDSKDIKLIANKIKYGEEFKTILDFGYLIAGSKDIKYKDSEMSNLISIKKAVSKNFFRFLLNNDNLLLTTIRQVNIDIFIKINRCLELGQLNANEYAELLSKIIFLDSNNVCRVWNFDLGFKLSYQEFNELFDVHNYKIFECVAGFKELKSSLRLLKIKEIKELYNSLHNQSFMFEPEEAFAILGNRSIKEEMRNNNPLDIENMSEYLNYLILNERYGISDMQDYRKYILANTFVGIENIQDKNIDEVIMNCNVVEDIMNFLNLSDDFKNQYSNEIFSFLISEEFRLVYGYYKNRNVNKLQLDSLALIAKSIIAGKYDDLKFVREDIEKEAGTNISDVEFDNWKRTDEVSYKNYVLRDESDFKYIMKMGEVPVRSCMHYESGGYSKCLLSNFDTTKKILTIHKNGRYVGRAIIRLTKMSDRDYVSAVDGLSFIDVDSKSLEEVALDTNENSNKDETLILFLEKLYTTLDKKDVADLYDSLVDFLKDKSERVGAKLVISRSYEDVALNVTKKYEVQEKYVFITASKNGYQYLDSFDGSTTNAYCYKKGKVLIY